MTSTLPVRPDLAHLRGEAQQLLDGLRAADPSAIARLGARAPDRVEQRAADTIGVGYSHYRQPDRRLVRAVHQALRGARTAESLPLADKSVDAAMAVMTMHHWSDLERGLSEMRRVTRNRIVLLTIDADVGSQMRLLREYVPEIADSDQCDFPSIAALVRQFGPTAQVHELPVPADCTDGFGLALWNRPEALLDPAARAATSGFARMDKAREQAAVARLRRDLESGDWDRRYGHLRTMTELDVGLRLLTAELA